MRARHLVDGDGCAQHGGRRGWRTLTSQDADDYDDKDCDGAADAANDATDERAVVTGARIVNTVR